MYTCALFNGINGMVTPNLMQQLHCTNIVFEKNQQIKILKNELGIVLSGKLFVTSIDEDGRRSIIEILLRGDAISSEMFYAGNHYITATAKTEVLFVQRDKIFSSGNARLCENAANLLFGAVRRRYTHIDILSKKTTEKKLAAYLDQQSIKQGARQIRVPMSYSDLADYLSADRCAMMRELKKMQTNGQIEVDGKNITILK